MLSFRLILASRRQMSRIRLLSEACMIAHYRKHDSAQSTSYVPNAAIIKLKVKHSMDLTDYQQHHFIFTSMQPLDVPNFVVIKEHYKPLYRSRRTAVFAFIFGFVFFEKSFDFGY